MLYFLIASEPPLTQGEFMNVFWEVLPGLFLYRALLCRRWLVPALTWTLSSRIQTCLNLLKLSM